MPDKFATAALASMALVIAPLAMAVALPTLVTGPVKLAFVVTVAALPVMLPAIGAVTVNPVKVPTEVMAGCAAVVTVPAVVAVVAVAALPVMLPAIGLVTVRLPRVPTEVSEELTTFDARVVPVRVLASATAVTVMSADPSKGTPLMFFVAASLVAVPALPVTLPAMGAVTVNPVNVPTEVMAGWAAVVTVPAVVAVVAVAEHNHQGLGCLYKRQAKSL